MTYSPNDVCNLELIEKAQKGCKASMESVIELTQDRIPPYILRLTLNHDLAQDILQETLLEIHQSLQSLKKIEAFWPWVYKITFRKVQTHFRRHKNVNEISLSIIGEDSPFKGFGDNEASGPEKIAERELKEAICESIKELNLKQRNALILRCFEEKSYREIAEIMNCSETSAKINLFRARKQLKKDLRRKGLVASSLTVGLGLFGEATQSAEAAGTSVNAGANITVNSASIKVGIVATVIGSIFTKLGATVTMLLVTSAITVGGMLIYQAGSDEYSEDNSPGRNEVKSFHYVEQAFDDTTNKVTVINRNLAAGLSLSKGAYEQMFFFPDGIDGPLFLMMQRWDPSQTNKLCGWMQNGAANYYYHSGKNIIYLYDYNLPIRDLSTRRLPSDTPEFAAFMDEMEGKTEGITNTRDEKTGMLVGIMDDRFYNAKDFKSKVTYNSFEAKNFDNFRYPWPDDAEIVDDRDAMHKRGWTYVQISGNLGDEEIKGVAQVPFTYNKSLERKPWIKIKVGSNGPEFVDSDFGANVREQGKIVKAYPAGNFFMGMARPWFGIHTVDIIRRDAAAKKIRFAIEEVGETSAKVTLTCDAADGQEYQLVYLISIDFDLVEEIGIFSQGSEKGVIKFDYLEDVEDMAILFEPPQEQRIPRKAKNKNIGIGWLLELAEDGLRQ